MISGLNTLSSKLPEAPPIPTATSFPITCAQTIVIASDWVGFTLPGMIELPGSFSGIDDFAEAGARTGGSQRTSLAIFISADASVLSAPCSATSGSWPPSAANLFGALLNGRPVRLAMCRALRSANSGCVLRPVPTAVPPSASSYTSGSAASMARIARSSCATHPQISCPSVSGVASWRCVRPTLTMSLNAAALSASVPRS